jgi:polar amino acid transport system substrate-binding protein
MKKIFYFLLIFIVLFLGLKRKLSNNNEQLNLNTEKSNVTADNNSVQIAFFNVNPHVYLDVKTGKIKGALYEMIEKHIAPEMGIKFIWDKKATIIPRQLAALKTEKNYAVALLTPTPERVKISAYTEKPFFFSKASISVHKNNKLQKITSPEDLIGMKIGYADKAFITPFMRDSRITLDFNTDPNYHEINYKKLLANRIDGVYAPDKASLLALSKRMKISGKIKVLDLPEKATPFHVVFDKSSADIAEKYNKAFDKLKGQQLYLKILKKYLDTSQL